MRELMVLVFCCVVGLNLVAFDASKAKKWLPLETSQEDMGYVLELIPAPGIEFKLSDDYDQARLFPSAIGLYRAAILALLSFISDDGDEESPLHLSYEEEGDSGKKQLIRNLKNSSVFGLLTIKDLQDPVLGPKREVDISKNWIFYLQIDDLDFTFWAVVDRSGREATYNFGFN